MDFKSRFFPLNNDDDDDDDNFAGMRDIAREFLFEG